MSVSDLPPAQITRREWLLMRAVDMHSDRLSEVSVIERMTLAIEAVASVALEHPEIDYDNERRTWAEWEAGGA